MTTGLTNNTTTTVKHLLNQSSYRPLPDEVMNAIAWLDSITGDDAYFMAENLELNGGKLSDKTIVVTYNRPQHRDTDQAELNFNLDSHDFWISGQLNGLDMNQVDNFERLPLEKMQALVAKAMN